MSKIKTLSLAGALLVGSSVLALAQSGYTSGAGDNNAHAARSSYAVHSSGSGHIERGPGQ